MKTLLNKSQLIQAKVHGARDCLIKQATPNVWRFSGHILTTLKTQSAGEDTKMLLNAPDKQKNITFISIIICKLFVIYLSTTKCQRCFGYFGQHLESLHWHKHLTNYSKVSKNWQNSFSAAVKSYHTVIYNRADGVCPLMELLMLKFPLLSCENNENILAMNKTRWHPAIPQFFDSWVNVIKSPWTVA